MVDIEEGKYYWNPHRNKWGVWRRMKNMGVFIADFATKIQAINFCKKMNCNIEEDNIK